jgi:guanidinopropionase
MTDSRFRPIDPAVTPRFADVATLLRARRMDPEPGVEIALCGAPFDLGANHRSGARLAPAAIREASRFMRLVHPTLGIPPFEITNVADVGDAPVNPLDAAVSLERMETFFTRLHGLGAVPLVVGGDHTVPLPVLRGIARGKPVGVVQFDAHPDTLDSLQASRINHATTFRRAFEEGLIDPARSIQIGLRGPQFSRDDAAGSRELGFRVVTMDEYEEMGRAAVIAEIDRVTDEGPVYISFDIDGLDPSEAIGTGVPEAGGLRVRDVQVIIRSLAGKNIVGGDICEVSPGLDPSGLTAVNAANILWEMLCVTAAAVSRRRGKVSR